MGELYCTHAREEVRRGQPERTKRSGDPVVEMRMAIKEKCYVRLYFFILLIIGSNTMGML